MTGRVLKGLSGFYDVYAEGQTVKCRARGILKKKGDALLPGDIVLFSIKDGEGIIEGALERKNALVRPPVANVDIMFVVIATAEPSPSLLVTDKLIAQCEENNIEPVICISKTDLKSPRPIADIYKKAGFEVLETSIQDMSAQKRLKDLVTGKVCVLGGSSGVGKSSLLAGMGISAAVGEVSERTGRGRHTTRHVELFGLHGGFIADAPGFNDIDFQACLRAGAREAAALFREFKRYTGGCRFADCAHINEPGCAIKAAVKAGEISAERYESYMVIYEESASRREKWQ